MTEPVRRIITGDTVGQVDATVVHGPVAEDSELGFQVVSSPEVESLAVTGLVERIAARAGERPVRFYTA
jgi:hypothetical protein